MTIGRPRTTSLPPDQMIKLGKEMLTWVKQNDPLHLCEWWSIEKGFTEKQWDAFQQIPEFLPYYERALKLVGLKYLDKTSNIRDSICHRWQRVYFKDLKKSEDETFARELKMKTELAHAQNLPPREEVLKLEDKVIELQEKLRKLVDDLKS